MINENAVIGTDVYSVRYSRKKLCNPSAAKPMPVPVAESEYNTFRSMRSTIMMTMTLAVTCTSATMIAHKLGDNVEPASLKMACVYVINGQAPQSRLPKDIVTPMSIAFFAAGCTIITKYVFFLSLKCTSSANCSYTYRNH